MTVLSIITLCSQIYKTGHMKKLKSSGKNIAKATDVKIISVNSLTNGQQRWPGTGSRCYVTANANVTVQYYPEGSSTNLDLVLELMKKTSSGGYSQAMNI